MGQLVAPIRRDAPATFLQDTVHRAEEEPGAIQSGRLSSSWHRFNRLFGVLNSGDVQSRRFEALYTIDRFPIRKRSLREVRTMVRLWSIFVICEVQQPTADHSKMQFAIWPIMREQEFSLISGYFKNLISYLALIAQLLTECKRNAALL